MQIDTEGVDGDKRSQSRRRLLSLRPTEVVLRGLGHRRGDLGHGRGKVADDAVGSSDSEIFSVSSPWLAR